MQIPERTANSTAYRYGFNSKEKDERSEFGSLTHYDYGFRIYNPGIGRFLSVDPLDDHPNQVDKSPYSAFWNNPIKYNDPDGRCPICPFIIIGFLMLESQPASTPGSHKDHLTIKQAQDDYNKSQLLSLIPGRKQARASQVVAAKVVKEIKNEVKEKVVKKTFDEARQEAFDKAGMQEGNVEFSKYDKKTGTVVEFKGKDGAKVAYDGPHPSTPGNHHDKPHVGWQSAGKRGRNGAQRNNIPYVGPIHPSRTDIKIFPFLKP